MQHPGPCLPEQRTQDPPILLAHVLLEAIEDFAIGAEDREVDVDQERIIPVVCDAIVCRRCERARSRMSDRWRAEYDR